MNTIFNRLTGKDKLIEDNDKLQNELLVLHKKAIRLAESYSQLKIEIEELHKEKTHCEQKLYNYEIEHFHLDQENNKLQEELGTIKNSLKSLYDKNMLYKNYYGDLDLQRHQNLSLGVISATDWDKSFFDVIKEIRKKNFNQEQTEAIRYPLEKNLRIIAGAGSGKTETICAKAAYLVQMKGVPQSQICMVTFTKKAAQEMADRVNKFLSESKSEIVVGTFHGIFKRLFEELVSNFTSLENVGIQGEDPLKGGAEYNKLIKLLVKQYKLDDFDNQGDKKIKERIEYWTNLSFGLENMVKFIKKYFDKQEAKVVYSEQFKLMIEDLSLIRKDERIVIFDDYMQNLFKAMLEYENARNYIRSKFKYLFIDEFQDINPLQMEIVKLICPPDSSATKLIIVGDDDQSIYAFRGADPAYIKKFPEYYDTYSIELMTNYRSRSNIVQAGNRVISFNSHDRIEKKMVPYHTLNQDAIVVVTKNSSEEANWVIERCLELGKSSPFVHPVTKKEDYPNFASSVALYRNKNQLQTMFQVLLERNIPFVIDKDDLMGIFTVSAFNDYFIKWQQFMKNNMDKTSSFTWSPILNQVAFHYYVKNQAKGFIIKNEQFDTKKIDDFVGFVKANTKTNDVEPIRRYLQLLIKLKAGLEVSMLEVFNEIIQFPIIKNSLQKEDIDWIKTELNKKNTWELLLKYHDSLIKKNQKMKDDLVLYQKGELNAFYLLTIHKSKGLAFENVFVIGCYDGGIPSSKAIDLKSIDNLQERKEKAEPPSTIEEERRLMYVAVTRAQNNLYLTLPKTLQDKPIPRSRFLKELDLPIKEL